MGLIIWDINAPRHMRLQIREKCARSPLIEVKRAITISLSNVASRDINHAARTRRQTVAELLLIRIFTQPVAATKKEVMGMRYLGLIVCALFVFDSRDFSQANEKPIVPFEVWSDSAKTLDHIKLSYEINSKPTQDVLAYIKTNPPDESLRSKVIDMFSRAHTIIDISRQGSKYKYRIKKNISALDLNSAEKGGEGFASPKVDCDLVEIHSPSGFYYLDNLNHSGVFRVEWPLSPETPLSLVQPPSEVGGMTARFNEGQAIIEFRDKTGKSAKSYSLDSRFGMMPAKIEFFDIMKNGDLFLYRVVKIDNYLQTKQGAYIPESGTIYDFASRESGQLKWQVEDRFKLTKSEIGIDIPDSEFELKFPPGTSVTDYTIDVNYLIPQNGKNPIFSVLNSGSASQ